MDESNPQEFSMRQGLLDLLKSIPKLVRNTLRFPYLPIEMIRLIRHAYQEEPENIVSFLEDVIERHPKDLVFRLQLVD